MSSDKDKVTKNAPIIGSASLYKHYFGILET